MDGEGADGRAPVRSDTGGEIAGPDFDRAGSHDSDEVF